MECTYCHRPIGKRGAFAEIKYYIVPSANYVAAQAASNAIYGNYVKREKLDSSAALFKLDDANDPRYEKLMKYWDNAQKPRKDKNTVKKEMKDKAKTK